MRIFLLLCCCLSVAVIAGCPTGYVSDGDVPVADASDSVALRDLVANTLAENLEHRRLSVDTHGAWQILHGILAYGRSFTIETPDGPQSAVDWILAGHPINGFDGRPGDRRDVPIPDGTPNQQDGVTVQRVGLRMEMEPATKIGQGHRDQWLAILAQTGLTLQDELVVGGRRYTIEDWLWQAEYDLPRNLELEFSWTLIPLVQYRGTEYRWIARDGYEYSVTELVESEVSQDLASSVCGGTHRLIGLAIALDHRRRESRAITGIWADVQHRLAEHVALAKQNQNPDGSYSTAYMHRTGWARDLGESLGTTGHTLEFLTFAASEETLREPWVERTVRRLCRMLKQCESVDLECGVLYHALHGLAEYQKRRGWAESTHGQ